MAKILIIEDDRAISDIERDYLELSGFETDVAYDGVDGRELKLKNREFELLLFLLRHPNQVFSREDLYEMIWGLESMGDNITVAVHINRLREKIEKDPSAPEYIQTVWGVGYRLKIV